MMRSAIFWPIKQQLCTIFRTLVMGQSRAISLSVMYLPRNVHGGNASHGTIFTTQPCNERNRKFKKKLSNKPVKIDWFSQNRWMLQPFLVAKLFRMNVRLITMMQVSLFWLTHFQVLLALYTNESFDEWIPFFGELKLRHAPLLVGILHGNTSVAKTEVQRSNCFGRRERWPWPKKRLSETVATTVLSHWLQHLSCTNDSASIELWFDYDPMTLCRIAS